MEGNINQFAKLIVLFEEIATVTSTFLNQPPWAISSHNHQDKTLC